MTNDQKETRLIEMENLLREKKESGLSIQEFCKQKNITKKQFNYCYIYLKKRSNSSPKLAPVKILGNELSDNGVIRITLPDGCQLTLPVHLDINRVKKLVEALLSC